MLLGGLLVVDLMALSLVSYVIRGRRELLRESALIGFILWGCAIIGSTEALSLFRVLGFWQVLIFWLFILLGCLVYIGKQRRRGCLKELFFSVPEANGSGDVKPWPFMEQVSFNRVVFFSLCLGAIALVAPPSTYDAMTYHMSRVMHWIQNHSVQYYPTHIPRQLYYPNFPEYVILHFQLLSGGDHWANFVQWLGMCGSLIGVSLIARELGAASRGQILSALIAVTVPMGVLQATSTQTDYVETLWLCSFIYFFLCWRRALAWRYVLLEAASLGLAISTKGTAGIFAVPFLLWMLTEVLNRISVRKFLMMVIVACVAGMFCLGSFYRNTVFFHGHAAKVLSADADSLINTRFCWEGFEANVLRNLGLHVITPSKSFNAAIVQDMNRLASFLHVDLNRKDWSYIGYSFSIVDFRGDENYLGNPLHVLLFGVVLVLFVLFPRFRNRDAGFYLAALFLGWIAFSAILKWQPWNARFHLPMFIIFAPLAGLVIEKVHIRWIVSGAMGALFLSAWVLVFINVNKPIFSTLSIFYPQNRDFLHFITTPSPQSTYLEYEGVSQVLKKMGCKNIGLIMQADENEYLLWVALNPTADPSMRIESVLVDNASAGIKYPRGDFFPDAIIAINDDRSGVLWQNTTYPAVWHSAIEGRQISVFLKSQNINH